MNRQIKLQSNSAQLILDSLIKAGLDVKVISKKYNLLKVNYLDQCIFIKGTSFSVNLQSSCAITYNKYLTKKVLRLANILTPKSYLVTSSRQAREIIGKKNLFPCVLKPIFGTHGNGVYANIESLEELNEILPQVFPHKRKRAVLVEEFVDGKDYRVLVVGNTVSAIMERIPAHVIGDGVSTLRQLITRFNKDPRVGIRYEKPMCKIRINGEVMRILKKKGFNLGYKPAFNEQVFLRQNANISTGGIGMDATQEAPEIVRSTSIQAANAIEMKISGVDIIYNTFTKKAYVLELNNQPGIDIHHFPVTGRSQYVAQDIINYIFNQQDSTSRPINSSDKQKIATIQ